MDSAIPNPLVSQITLYFRGGIDSSLSKYLRFEDTFLVEDLVVEMMDNSWHIDSGGKNDSGGSTFQLALNGLVGVGFEYKQLCKHIYYKKRDKSTTKR